MRLVIRVRDSRRAISRAAGVLRALHVVFGIGDGQCCSEIVKVCWGDLSCIVSDDKERGGKSVMVGVGLGEDLLPSGGPFGVYRCAHAAHAWR
jgi:hypothetical protein